MHAPREAGGRRGRWWRAREGDNLLFREQLVKCEHHHQSGALARAIGTIAVSCRPSPALLSGFIASCCVCCSYTRTGRRRTSLRFLTMGTRNHTHLGLLVITYRRAAFVNTLKTKTGLMVARAAALRTNINIDGRPATKRRRTSSKACAPRILHACAPHFHLPVN